MKTRKIIALVFLTIAIVLGIIFYSKIAFPQDLQGYFETEYLNQFGPLAISIELFVAGIYLFIKHPKTNFVLALFAFTAILDPFFNLIGLFTSMVPTYAMILFLVCALLSLWLAFSNKFGLGRISFLAALWSFVLGTTVELFFNYLYKII